MSPVVRSAWDDPAVGPREWLSGRRSTPEPRSPASGRSDLVSPRRPALTFTTAVAPLVKLAGTTTFAADAIKRLADRRALVGRGLLEENSVLEREPRNEADPSAVAVLIEGERIGYLPSYVARVLPLDTSASLEVPVQLAYLVEDELIRAEAWVWLGESPPQWQYGADNLPPLKPREKRAAEHHKRREMVAEALASGGARTKSIGAGMVSGVHYLELVEPIKELKREGRHTEALELCYAAIRGAESDRREGPQHRGIRNKLRSFAANLATGAVRLPFLNAGYPSCQSDSGSPRGWDSA